MPDQTNTAEAVERLTWVSGTKTGNPQYGVVVAVEDLSVVLKDYVQRGCDIDEAKGLLEASDRENHRLRSRIMELEKALASRVGSRSGPAMTAVVAALHERPDHEWTTAEVLASAPAFVSKQIYNALGYLVRHGRLNKSGYGRYRLPADRVLTEGRK